MVYIILPELTMTSCIPSLLKEVDVVFTMLPSGLIVKDIINEFIGDFCAKSTLIDCSTIDVKTTKEVCKTLNKKDISIDFSFKFTEVKYDMQNFMKLLTNYLDVLHDKNPPTPSETCETCNYFVSAGRIANEK